MIKIIPATIGANSPLVYAVEIDENICQGYNADNVPAAIVTIANNGSAVTAGSTTTQKVTFAVTITYQPCCQSSETKTKTFAETYTFAAPGAVTITPAIGAVSVIPTKVCCNGRANGVKILTSVNVAFA